MTVMCGLALMTVMTVSATRDGIGAHRTAVDDYVVHEATARGPNEMAQAESPVIIKNFECF